jgi:flagellar L-ring protein precursor FlgH
MNTRTTLVTCCVVAALAAMSVAACADSLWTERARPLVADRRAAKVGDILTILVVERSAASHQASHDTDKKLDAGGGPGVGMLSFFPSLSLQTERATSGKGSTAQSTQFVDQLSGTITGVTPEGLLRVEATRQVKLNRDELKLTVTGTVRPDDVSPENTVVSTQIANCQIAWTGQGPIPDKQRPGLISALLSLLW